VSAPDYQAIFESAPGLYLILRPDFVIVGASNAYLRATMTIREQIVGRGIFEVFPDNPDDPSATGVRNLRASLERVVRNHKPDTMAVQKYDVRRDTPENGFEERYWSPINLPVMNVDGALAWIIHRVEDVTDFINLRRRAVEDSTMREHVKRMEGEVFARAQEIQEANRALRESQAELTRLNETLEQRIVERTRQLEAEIQERVRVQDSLRETQKLEAIGRVAGGVAHDFNNLLTVIQGSAELLAEHDKGGTIARTLSAIMRASERGERLTRQLLAFSRHQALRPERIDLPARAENISELLTRSLRGDIRVALTFSADLWAVVCDAGELELALLNICVNARDAMPAGGLVRIEADNVVLPSPLHPKVDLVGEFVSIAVSDTGAGIPAGVLERVFEPFFTTKDIGKGTGLGLNQVRGFAEQAGGAAAIASQVGVGTIVTLYLPQARGAAAAADATAAKPMIRGTGTVLLVEDDDEVAETATKLLTMIGYKASRAQDARTALALLLGGQTFDLVFSDIIMPGGMSGLDLARRIRRHFPDMPILLASGYSHAAAEVAREGLAIIAKPYRAEGLSDAIRRAIAAHPLPRRNNTVAP
jgi:signal transduction histidine kinase/ActR/RegA family two-component response regulator